MAGDRAQMRNAWMVALLLAASGSAWAGLYKVNVRRMDADLYKADSGLYIKTRFCYEYVYGEVAILKYEPHAFDNKLIFDSGESCDVTGVFK